MDEGKRGKGMWEGVKRMCVGKKEGKKTVTWERVKRECVGEREEEGKEKGGGKYVLIVYLSLDTSCCSKV